MSIFYLQDILILPDYQRRGIGRMLLEDCLARFSHVRTKVLMTDDEARQKAFYESLGYRNTRDLEKVRKMMETNYAGEITKRTLPGAFLY